MLARGQVDRGFGQRLPGLESAGVGDGQRAGDVDAVDLGVEGSVAAGGGEAEVEVVGAGVGNGDGVLEPLRGFDVADVVSAAGVGGGLDVDALGESVGAAVVFTIDVVIGDAFAAVVEVFGFDGGGGG